MQAVIAASPQGFNPLNRGRGVQTAAWYMPMGNMYLVSILSIEAGVFRQIPFSVRVRNGLRLFQSSQ